MPISWTLCRRLHQGCLGEGKKGEKKVFKKLTDSRFFGQPKLEKSTIPFSKYQLLGLVFVLAFTLSHCYALPAGSNYDGSAIFHQEAGDRTLDGRIDYAIYGIDNFDWGPDPVPEGEFVYAYQIFNDGIDDEILSVQITFFSVSILEQGGVLDIGSIGSGIEPWHQYLSPDPQSAEFWFTTSNGHSVIGSGQSSNILYITSNYGVWDYQPAGVHGGSLVAQLSLPTPVPEPATIMLLGCGFVLGSVRLKKRREHLTK